MEPSTGDGSSEATLADRLARLAERRRATSRRYSSPTTSSDDEAEACMPPKCSAMQALRELLQGRGAALEGAIATVPGSTEHVPLPPQLPPPVGDDGGRQVMGDPTALSLQPGRALQQPVFSQEEMQAATVRDDAGHEASSAGSSVPPTARLLISLSSDIGRQAAAVVRQQRTAEIRDTDAAVREAEIQRAELDALLLRQRASELQRERQRAKWQAELVRIQLELACQHMAAWRIGWAWRRFLASPDRQRKIAAATRIQALWRGCASRRRTAVDVQQHRQRRDSFAALHAAIAAGDLAKAQQAAEQLAALGAGPQAAQQVEALEQQAEQAEQALQDAAGKGNFQAFQAAAAAAKRYSHLHMALVRAQHQFGSRVAAAEDAVRQAAESGPLLQFTEAVSAAAALGVGGPFLTRAEQRITARNQEAAAALQAALEAKPFSSSAFHASLQHAQHCGLHADAARAQRALQLRRHRCSALLKQVAEQGSAEAVQAACQEAELLGMEADVEAGLAKLEQRQAAATEELRQAAYRGSLREYEAAAEAAADLQISAAVRKTCAEQLRQRQQEAEQQLRLAAAEHGSADLAAVRKRCKAATLLGLGAAVSAAEQEVLRRRDEAVQQLVRSTQAACEFASRAAKVGREHGDAAAAAMCATPRGTPWQQLLSAWLASTQELTWAVQERGALAALMHPPAACVAWPNDLRAWLDDAHHAARFELEQPVLAAATTLQSHLESLQAAAQVAVVPLQPTMAGGSTRADSSRGSASTSKASASGCLVSARSRLGREASLDPDPQQQHVPSSSRSQPAGSAQSANLLTCFQQWQAKQQQMVPLVAFAAQRDVDADAHADDDDEAGSVPQVSDALDLSCQGLNSLEVLGTGGIPPLATLDLSTNALTSLEALSALHSLRELRVSSNQLASLHSIAALGRLTLLDASCNSLENLPSLTSLASLRHLDLSSNRLTAAALAAAGFQIGACAQLTSLRLADNPQLSELGSWLRPMPSLLRLDISGCGLASLDGLAEAAPLLQVLAASRNTLIRLPLSLSLPFLRELWLGGNHLSEVRAWPWLPSLRELHLQDNQLACLALMQGLPSLQALDLSFNQLRSLAATLANLAPLSGTLEQLRLNDNPLAAPLDQAHDPAHGWLRPAAVTAEAEAGRAYAAAVFSALPGLRELDSHPISREERQQHLHAAARRAAPLAAAPRGASCGLQQASLTRTDWDAHTVLWALEQPAAVEMVQQSTMQQLQSAMQPIHCRSEPFLSSPEAATLANALLRVQLAAGAGVDEQQQRGGRGQAFAGPPALPVSAGGQGLLRLAQQQYLMLATAEPAAAQGVLLLNSAHYQRFLAELSTAATRIQSAWRACCARRLRHRLAVEQQAARAAAAASHIQAAWRGWACRQRGCAWVQHRLVIWRHHWREAQRQLQEHHRQCAAVRIQAVWRGARVRMLLARARQALQVQQLLLPSHVGVDEKEGSLDLELSSSSLDGLLEGTNTLTALFTSPEVLRPEVVQAGGVLVAGLNAAHAPVLAAQLDSSVRLNHLAVAGMSTGAHQEWPRLPAVPAVCWPARAAAPCSSPGSSSGSPSLPLLSPLAGTLDIVDSTAAAGVAAAAGACPGASADWEFSDPATASAFMQLRQRQRAAARRRELQQQLKDPVQRLQHFQGKGAAPVPRGRPGLSATAPGWLAAAGASCDSSTGSGSRRSTGGSSSSSSGGADWALPALPCLRSLHSPSGGSRPSSRGGSPGKAASCQVRLPPAGSSVCSPRSRRGNVEVRGKSRGYLPSVHVLQPFESA